MKKLFVLVITIFLFYSNIYSIDIVDKAFREQFAIPVLNKGYYNHQVMTTSFYDRQQASVNGLIESFRGTSNYTYDLFSRSFIVGSKGILDAQAFVYDSSIASICYILAGQTKKSENLFRIFQREFYMQKGEHYGLCNAYKTDVPRKRWGLTHGIDGNRVHLGPNMWVAIAIIQYTAITGKTDFVPFLIDMLKWAKQVKHYKFSDGKLGAPSMGYGWQPPNWSTVYSTENVVDYYAVLKMMKYIYNNSVKNVKPMFDKAKYSLQDIDEEMENIERWLTKLIYDKKKKSFNMGYNANGVDRTDALDTVSWTIPALTPKRLEELNISPFDMMQFAEDNYLVTDVIENKTIKGYDFTNQKGRNKNYRMVWFEGTGFHITALQVMSEYAEKVGKKELAEQYKKQAVDILIDMKKASLLVDLVDKSLPYTSKRPTDKDIYTTFEKEWEIPRGKNGTWVSSSSSTGWYLIAASAFNPLDFDIDHVKYKLFNNNIKEIKQENKDDIDNKKNEGIKIFIDIYKTGKLDLLMDNKDSNSLDWNSVFLFAYNPLNLSLDKLFKKEEEKSNQNIQKNVTVTKTSKKIVSNNKISKKTDMKTTKKNKAKVKNKIAKKEINLKS